MRTPFPENVPGDWYVEKDCCIICAVPRVVAPDLFSWAMRPDGSEVDHCYVSRQPQSEPELDRMIEAARGAEVECIRYRGLEARSGAHPRAPSGQRHRRAGLDAETLKEGPSRRPLLDRVSDVGAEPTGMALHELHQGEVLPMSREEYVPWAPLPGLPSVLYVEALHDDAEGLRILLRGEDKTSRALRVTFNRVVGYRNINESFRLRTWTLLASAPTRTSLLMVRGSAWVEWLVEESAGLLDGRALTHYAVHTGEDCIDVVVESPPLVEWL